MPLVLWSFPIDLNRGQRLRPRIEALRCLLEVMSLFKWENAFLTWFQTQGAASLD
jgi:hypothetical protein